MPHRRRTVPALVLAATAALAAGCSVDLPVGSVPAPFSIAPTPSASAGVPKYVCSTVYRILTEGAVRVAQQSSGSGDPAAVRGTLADMAAQVDAEAARTTDADLRQALAGISADLTAGSRQTDPEDFLTGKFETVGRRLDGHCG